MDAIDARLLNLLQEEVPLSPRPFLEIADQAGIPESECLERVQKLLDSGVIRRLGGVFNSPNLGMKSTLCTVSVAGERIEAVAEIINSYPEVTHNYVREHDYNIWFTVTAGSETRLNQVIAELGAKIGSPVVSMPVKKRYKIKVAFPIDE